MKTWTAVVIGRYGDKLTLVVAAPSFFLAIKKVKQVGRKGYSYRRLRFISLVETATLDG